MTCLFVPCLDQRVMGAGGSGVKEKGQLTLYYTACISPFSVASLQVIGEGEAPVKGQTVKVRGPQIRFLKNLLSRGMPQIRPKTALSVSVCVCVCVCVFEALHRKAGEWTGSRLS